MSKTLKWLYRLGYTRGRNSIIVEIERRQQDHSLRSQIASLRSQDKYDKPKMSSKEHGIAADTLYELLTKLDPKKYPSFDSYLDKML